MCIIGLIDFEIDNNRNCNIDIDQLLHFFISFHIFRYLSYIVLVKV